MTHHRNTIKRLVTLGAVAACAIWATPALASDEDVAREGTAQFHNISKA